MPAGQEIVCYFSQGHAMVTKNLLAKVVQGIPAFRDLRICDPHYFVIQFQALIS